MPPMLPIESPDFTGDGWTAAIVGYHSENTAALRIDSDRFGKMKLPCDIKDKTPQDIAKEIDYFINVTLNG